MGPQGPHRRHRGAQGGTPRSPQEVRGHFWNFPDFSGFWPRNPESGHSPSDWPQTPQDWPQTPQDWPRTPQDCPRTPQDGHGDLDTDLGTDPEPGTRTRTHTLEGAKSWRMLCCRVRAPRAKIWAPRAQMRALLGQLSYSFDQGCPRNLQRSAGLWGPKVFRISGFVGL